MPVNAPVKAVIIACNPLARETAMSQALDYLIQARPEAMQPYFAFLKAAGRRLDPKTRALISLISKVHSQTERGFRQYLTRALRSGASADEVLDALLMAFPMLGLTRVVWAVDQLLALDLPEFRLGQLGHVPDWHALLPLSELPPSGTRRLQADGRAVFVHRADGDCMVYDAHCPHQSTDIPELAIDGERLTCPRHGWSFDLRSGKCVAKGSRPLRALACREQDGTLWAFW
jgi:nitrite reductase/ring-hydroxylating ferredoxin subunit/alkylhydroperoxidase/carboxymuconolactone decarboxylase family protein YurZ